MAVISARRRAVTSLLALLSAGAVAAGAGIAPGQGAGLSATGTLELRASLALVSNLGVCPPGVTGDACAERRGAGRVPGLRSVKETYTWSYRMGPPTCPSDLGKPVATTGRLAVVAQGEIFFAVTDGARCIEQEPLRNELQDFTIRVAQGPMPAHRVAARSSAR